MSDASGSGGSRRLEFTVEQGGPTNWCWAATAAAVTVFYHVHQNLGEALTPCEVATDCLSQPCCPAPTDPADSRNREYDLQGALRYTRHLAGDPLQWTLDM